MASMNEEAISLTLKKFGEDVDIIASAFSSAMQQLLASLQPTVDAFGKAATQLYDACYQTYVSEGAIYGQSHEGMMRWMGERNQAAALRANEQYGRDRQWAIDDFRRQVNERKANRG